MIMSGLRTLVKWTDRDYSQQCETPESPRTKEHKSACVPVALQVQRQQVLHRH